MQGIKKTKKKHWGDAPQVTGNGDFCLLLKTNLYQEGLKCV